MNYLITESQLKTIVENEEKILHIPDVKIFGSWKNMQDFLETKGNPLYSLGSGIMLTEGTGAKTLGNLVSISGSLDISDNDIIRSLGELRHVGGSLVIARTTYIKTLNKVKTIGGTLYAQNSNLKNLGELESIGLNCYLDGTPLVRELVNAESIKKRINIGGVITIRNKS